MPLHDWARVQDNIFHSFHNGWLWNLAFLLNQGILPAGYLARTEEYLRPYETDLLALETGQTKVARPASDPHKLTATICISPPAFIPRKSRRLSIFSAREERRVAVVELVSPGNKDARRRAEVFRAKLFEIVASGLHLLLVDILPATGVAPGFACALARDLGAREDLSYRDREIASFECAPDEPEVRVYLEWAQLGKQLPEAPLFLEVGNSIVTPLEESYAMTIEQLAAADRESIERHAEPR